MQNVLDVASLSPPQVTNATKSAISTTPAADQVSFDLILSMASSESVQKTEYNQNARQENESVSTDVERVSNSISNSRNDEVQNRKEIEKKESEKPSTNKKTDDEDEIKEEAVAVLSKNRDVENQDQSIGYEDEEAETIDNSTVLVDDSVNKSGLEVLVDQVTRESLSSQELENDAVTKNGKILDSSIIDDISEEITKPVLIKEDNTASIEIETEISTESEEDALSFKNGIFNQDIKKTDKAEVDSNNLEKNVKNQITDASLKDGTVITKNVENASPQNLETNENPEASTDSVITAKDEKIEMKVSAKSDAAPPGATITESVPSNATVSQVTQLSEPARLAEAPKTKVVTQITNEIDQMVKTNRSSLRVQLYPEELGHIDLKIVSTKDGVGVTMIADKASTQEVLKSEMNSLKQTIEQAGIQLNDLNVGHGQNSNQQLYQENRNAAKSYNSMSSENKNSEINEKIVTLQTSVVDYKV